MLRLILVLLLCITPTISNAHDNSHPLKRWFDELRSAKGPCCSDADGSVVKDTDWQSKNGKYKVFLEGKWRDVPDEALVKVPNLYGRTMVWPIYHRGLGGVLDIEIRCFMPGPMT